MVNQPIVNAVDNDNINYGTNLVKLKQLKI